MKCETMCNANPFRYGTQELSKKVLKVRQKETTTSLLFTSRLFSQSTKSLTTQLPNYLKGEQQLTRGGYKTGETTSVSPHVTYINK